jgi:glucokinase
MQFLPPLSTKGATPPSQRPEVVILGIDIGGTKLAAGVISSRGQVLSYQRMPTPADLDAEGLLGAVVELAESVLRRCQVSAVALGVGCGGPMVYPEGEVSPLHITCWRDFPLRARLAERFALPTMLDNDAKAFALGEALFGAGRGARSLLGMVISTGVGGGVVMEGQLLHGASGNAGHIGHTVISRAGPRCPCGARGCLTAYSSGTGLAARARSALEAGSSSSLSGLANGEITGQTIAAAARSGDALSRRLLRDSASALARALVDAANILDLDRVVLGGGLVGAADLWLAPLRNEVQRRTRFLLARDLDIQTSGLGEHAGVIGAAALALAAWPPV